MGLKIAPKDMLKLSELYETFKTNETLCGLVKKFDGADPNKAYAVICGMTEHEKKILAVAIARCNTQFDR